LVEAMLRKIIPATNQHFAKRWPFSSGVSDLIDLEKAWETTGISRRLHGRKPTGNSIR
jgi:hypothetical protein